IPWAARWPTNPEMASRASARSGCTGGMGALAPAAGMGPTLPSPSITARYPGRDTPAPPRRRSTLGNHAAPLASLIAGVRHGGGREWRVTRRRLVLLGI